MSLIIADSEFAQAAQGLVNLSAKLQLLIERYQACLDQLALSGMKSNNIGAALSEHSAEVGEGASALLTTLEPIAEKTTSFVDEVDAIDQYFY